jgi:ankyrin repeat protein
VYCQLVYICGCIPARIRHALEDLPETLDKTYERTLREINKADWEFAHRLFQFVAVAVRPLRVEELAELLAFDFEAGPIPKFHEDWRLEDPMHAVLSTCRSFLAIVNEKTYYSYCTVPRNVVQFSHFSVKEFLTSPRLAEANDIILRRYHFFETPAHTLAARACLGYLLHLDTDVTRDSLRKLPFTEYSGEYWVDHARLEGVSRNVKDGLKELFDQSKPHLAICVWICNPCLPSWERRRQSERPPPLRGTPLHYAALWDLNSIVELLVNEHSQNVNSQDFTDSATPLHVASKLRHLEVARMLIERGAGVSAQDKDGQTPLHLALQGRGLEVSRMLMERVMGVPARGLSPLHLGSSEAKQLKVARMFIERGADMSVQDEDGQTPLHLGSEVLRMLIGRIAGVSAQNKDGQAPLALEFARMLIERGAGVSTKDKYGQTPLHLALRAGQMEAARMLIERGANTLVYDNDGQTPLHLALQAGQEAGQEAGQQEVARMLIDRYLSAHQNKEGQTLLHLAFWTPMHLALMGFGLIFALFYFLILYLFRSAPTL